MADWHSNCEIIFPGPSMNGVNRNETTRGIMMEKQTRSLNSTKNESSNADPLTGEAGAHPMGTGLGAAIGGATAGATAGTIAGPIGTVVGTIVGGIAGAYAGKAVAENIDPTVETNYWRNTYAKQPYYSARYQYEDYEPAYRAGWESYDPTVRSDWKDREAIAKDRWESEGGAPEMTWEEARLAAEDAYGRVNERAGNKPR